LWRLAFAGFILKNDIFMRKYLNKRNIIIAVAAVLLIGWWWRGKSAKKNGTEIRTATVQRGEVVSSITVSGEVKALKQATLNFPTSGKLSYLSVVDGDRVKRGQLLASMDLGDLQAAETKAYYTYLAYDAAAKKVEDDLKGKGASETFAEKSTRVTAQTNRDMAYDAWLTAQRAVKNAKLWAPFEGVVTGQTISVIGDTVGVTDGVTVVDPGSLYFSGEVDESDVGKLEIGQTVKLELDAYDDQEFAGTVDEIGFASTLSSTGATVFLVRIKFDPSVLSKLRLGFNGDATIRLSSVENVLKLPIDAVIDGKVILPGKEENKKEVETGLEGETEIEIKSGLNEGDEVVIK
jgi:RND family efflux transporter MFP subunit